MPDPLKDFFISYAGADLPWAEWIAWQLEEAGYSAVLQDWDFGAGTNSVLQVDRATREAVRTIAVLSPDYLTAVETQPQWAVAFEQDPTGEHSRLVTVHVRECRHELRGLLRLITPIDLVGLKESVACEKLLAYIRRVRYRPRIKPGYPGKVQHTTAEAPQFPGTLPGIWNVPYRRNLLFTSREDILKYLHETLGVDKKATPVQPQAISGLGGIGKTQIAIEYAYRYHSNYQAVLWARARSRKSLISSFLTIADAKMLNLSERNERDPMGSVAAVIRWLETHTDWLLILDNADDLAMASEFIPMTGRGHILLTTQAQAAGTIAQCIRVEEMEPEDGALLLLRCSKIIRPDTLLEDVSVDYRTKAKVISKTMGGLPLALEQAGELIERTGCGLSGCLDICRKQRTRLLERRSKLPPAHPEPVATTWLPSFKRIERVNRAAAELLWLCAFLHPDAIPEEFITKGAFDLGPVLQPVAADAYDLSIAIEELRNFSLVRRNSEAKTLTINPLVQSVLLDRLDNDKKRLLSERVVRVVNRALLDIEFSTWQHCQRYFLHVQVCAAYVEQWQMEFTEAAQLLYRAGYHLLYYLQENAQSAQEEMLLQQVLDIRAQTLGSEHFNMATILENYIALLRRLKRDTEATELKAHAMTIQQEKQAQETLFQ